MYTAPLARTELTLTPGSTSVAGGLACAVPVEHRSAEHGLVGCEARRAVSLWCAAAVAVVALAVAGCSKEEAPREFEPNLVQAMKYQIQNNVSMDQTSRDATWAVTRLFGTPDQPKLPEMVTEDSDLASIVSMEHLERASGRADAEGRGLYDAHCARCHGVTGSGRGITGAVLTPYPRDYRMGVFKFKSTSRGAKPTHEDIARLIRNGIPGTAMSKIEGLKEEDVQALTDYVIYLSWRGELERLLIDDAAMEVNLEDGERVINTEWAESTVTEEKETFDEQWGYVEDHVTEIGDAWLEAEDEVYEVPEPPAGLPVAQSHEDFVKLSQGDQAGALAASVEKGHQLFIGKVASCSKCHGEKGLGDGQTTDYDDWTKDWTARVGLDPKDHESLVPLLARGAFPPINALPRNFAEGAFHGGSSSEDLYRRIAVGIAGTPMPAATFVDGQFEKDDVWHLINYIRSLQTAPDTPPGAASSTGAGSAPGAGTTEAPSTAKKTPSA